MTEIKLEPPIRELILINDNMNPIWVRWFSDLKVRMNERPSASGLVSGNLVKVDANDNLEDSGFTDAEVEAGNTVNAEYVGERYITENLLHEAGTEEGARFGSFRIGLNTEDDYAFFDENGKLIFYGLSGVRLITPVNATSTTKYAVFDSSGNIKYRTIEEVTEDLDLPTKTYVGERYITENLLPEADAKEEVYNSARHFMVSLF